MWSATVAAALIVDFPRCVTSAKTYPRLLMPPPLEAAVSSYSSPPRRTIPDHVSAPGPIKEIPVVDRQGHVDAKPPDAATLPRPRFPFRAPVFLIFLCRISEIALKLRGEAMGEWRLRAQIRLKRNCFKQNGYGMCWDFMLPNAPTPKIIQKPPRTANPEGKPQTEGKPQAFRGSPL